MTEGKRRGNLRIPLGLSQEEVHTGTERILIHSPAMIATIVLLVLMLLSGGGLIFYATIYVPHKVSSDATATAVSQATQNRTC